MHRSRISTQNTSRTAYSRYDRGQGHCIFSLWVARAGFTRCCSAYCARPFGPHRPPLPIPALLPILLSIPRSQFLCRRPLPIPPPRPGRQQAFFLPGSRQGIRSRGRRGEIPFWPLRHSSATRIAGTRHRSTQSSAITLSIRFIFSAPMPKAPPRCCASIRSSYPVPMLFRQA